MEALHQETFSVKFENTTDKICETTLSSERTVTASYEVDVHSSVQVGHNLQLSLEAGGDESMGKFSASYEFNKMLEQYKGEKTTKEQTTKMNTECPVEVKALSVTEAKFVTTYQDFKKTFNISSEFSGRLGVDIREKKKRGKKGFYKHLNIDVCDVFSDLKAKRDSPIADRIFISGTRPNWVVEYTSAATFSSSHGVDQHVRILNYPLPRHD
ncbi:uncharacterized protein [Watersipora subatra]|uniref:uncharacterized protein n=1 Tax=Watersipora subatra TaxID=2589382 RepID=UPI00355ADD86